MNILTQYFLNLLLYLLKPSEPSENTLISNIELNEDNTYSSEQEFIFAVKRMQNKIRLEKFEKNSDEQLFVVEKYASLLIQVMGFEPKKKKLQQERTIPVEIQERILLLRHAGCNIPTIRGILKEEFSDIKEEGTNREFNSDDFVKELEHLKSQDNEFCYELPINSETNEQQATRSSIVKAADLVFVLHGTKHTLCLWHLMKNLYDDQLKVKYPSATKYLEKMDKNLRRWAPCHNTKGRIYMKGYMDATTSQTNYLKAFESALEQRHYKKFLSEYFHYFSVSSVKIP
ncbi:hypothetical protein RhiirA4_478151 [Rhizophagus irregularis]|uniref:MULE transposase domain-containing protein n=1 Tax=Rhizophagus irregularis TaxID=588596 RepID=A0A2I1HDY8_9GLOM|nr:hypothetical protein RhiirA4_477947 [Rhizophagus irregularis]PKY57224.1 hypothetical protein RhiirA4_478151 [Rhizophagus irregularis]